MATLTQEARIEDARLYEALVSRDPRFDGRFFVGVRTTGVYCRPICPAPNPKPANCTYHRTAAAAERAGYRPCKRCRPETAPNSAAWLGTCATVRRALRLIADGAFDGGSVDELAARLGVGARHLRRLFDRHVGASPTEVAATQRLHLARPLLWETRLPMTDVAIAAGYSSLRRFNATFRDAYRSPPSEARVRVGSDGCAASPAAIALTLGYVPPYDWHAMLGFLRARAIAGVEEIDGDRYARTFELGGQKGILCVSDSARHDALRAEVWIDGVVSLLPVAERLRSMFDLDAEPSSVRDVLGLDPGLAPLVDAAPGLRVPGCWDPFELLVRGILGQQITVAAGRTFASRLTQAWGRRLAPGRGALLGDGCLFPVPAALADAGIEAIGVTGRRANTIRLLARAVADGSLRLDPGIEPAVLRRDLLAIPGIGEWTVGYAWLRALKDPDAFPAGDIALLRAAQRLGLAGTGRELKRAAERWRPWRAYAVMHLWRGTNQGA